MNEIKDYEIESCLKEILSEIKVSDEVKKWIDEDLDTFNHNFIIYSKRHDKYSFDFFFVFAFKNRIIQMDLFNVKNTKIKNEISYRQGVIRTYLNAVITAFGKKYVNTKVVIRKIIMKLMECEKVIE